MTAERIERASPNIGVWVKTFVRGCQRFGYELYLLSQTRIPTATVGIERLTNKHGRYSGEGIGENRYNGVELYYYYVIFVLSTKENCLDSRDKTAV